MLCDNYFFPTLRARRREHEEFFSRKISVLEKIIVAEHMFQSICFYDYMII